MPSRLAAVDLAGIAAVVGGYLIGSIDFGVIVPRLAGVDIYAVGSGNPGATNVLRSLGRVAAGAVLVGDLLKGVAAAAIGALAGGDVVGFAAGFAAVVGHCFPVWHRFRGGKGVAAAGGMAFWLEPLLATVLLAVWVSLVWLTKKASIASVTLGILFVPGAALFGHRGWSLVWVAGSAALILVRHQGNIRRLLQGAEHTIEGTAS